MTTGADEVAAIRQALGHITIQKPPECWLIPSYPEAAEVFGDPNRGIPYGKIFEFCGKYSSAKTAIVQELAADAQKIDNAEVGWIDLESSFDNRWAKVRGLDPSRVALFAAEVITDEKGKDEHIMTAEEIFKEAETWVKMKLNKNPLTRIFLGVDSTVAILSEAEEKEGLEGKRRGVLAAFLSKMLRRWAPIVRTHNVMFFLINQIRTSPNVQFGNPEYRPGGSALDHYTSVIVHAHRSQGKGHGWIYIRGEKAGIKTVLRNEKNKVGGQEWAEVGAKVYWGKRAKFLPVDQVKD